MRAVFKREFKGLFHDITGFLFIAAHAFFVGLFLIDHCMKGGRSDAEGILSKMAIVMAVLLPILLLKIKNGVRKDTESFMRTLPISAAGEVIGKYLATLAVIFISVILTLLGFAFIGFFGDINYLSVMSALLIYFLFSMLFASIYLFITVSLKGFNASAIVCYAVSVVIFAFGFFGVLLKKVGGGILESIARRVSPFLRVDEVVYGIFDITTVAYFLVLTVLFLLLGIFVADRRRANARGGVRS
ncbi:MAG: hypothetical protein J6Q78_06240 [Clostridia bacterium]|nr:hypothetical protein [Clostridia bacterium]